MKLYIVSNTESGKDNIDGIYFLISEEGEVLYDHWCSNKYFAKGDLIEQRRERIKECKEKFGEYQVLYLGEDEITREKLTELNKKWNEKHYKEDKAEEN